MVEDLKHEGETVGVVDFQDDALYFEPKRSLDITIEPFIQTKDKLRDEGYPMSWDSRGCLTIHTTENLDEIKKTVALMYSKILEEMENE